MDADAPVPTISSTFATATSIASSSNSNSVDTSTNLLLSSDSRTSTRSSTGAQVKSTFMKFNVSPPQVTKVKAKSSTPETTPTTKVKAKSSTPETTPTKEDKEEKKKKKKKSTDGDSETKNKKATDGDSEKKICELQELLQQQQTRIMLLENSLRDRDAMLERINQRLDYHDKEAVRTRTMFHIKDTVIERLRSEVTNLQQYTRRSSVVIAGIEKKHRESHEDLKNEVEKVFQKVDSGVTMDNVDKFHRNGPIRDGAQEVIVRFKTHSDKESFYKGRKQVDIPNIKIRPSLTKENKDLLNNAVEYLKKLHDEDDKLENPPHFVMANIHGQIQLKMKKEHDGRLFFPVTSMKELVNTIVRINHKDSDNLRFYISASEDEEDEYF